MADIIKEQEQKRMDYVVEKIKNEEETAKKKISRASADTKAIQADFKNNVRIKTGTYSGMMETALTVRQQQMQLEERENSRNQAAHRLEILERMEKKPYFARVDLSEQGEDKKKRFTSDWRLFRTVRTNFSYTIGVRRFQAFITMEVSAKPLMRRLTGSARLTWP